MSVMFYTDRVKKSILIILLVLISCSALTVYANDAIKVSQHSVNTKTTQEEQLFNFNNDHMNTFFAGDDPERFLNTTAEDYVPTEIDLKRRMLVPSDLRLKLFHFARRYSRETKGDYLPLPMDKEINNELDEFTSFIGSTTRKSFGPYITAKEMYEINLELKMLLD